MKAKLATAFAALALSFAPFTASAQGVTPPPGMILVDCPVRPAPWQAPGIVGHPGFDLNIDPSSAYAMARGVPIQCIAFPGGSEATYHKIIGLKVYIPRHGTDPGSQTGALATAVAIRDINGGTWNTTEAEFWNTGQDWRNYVSDDGRWVYSVRGGLNTQTCDVTSQPDYRRWPVMVTERDLISCLDKLWSQGGRLGMPVTPTVAPATPTPTVVSTPIPPVAQPVDDLRQRVVNLEQRQKNTESKLDQIIDILRGTPTPNVAP